MGEARPATGGEMLGGLSTDLVGLMKEAAGKGPTKTRSYWAGQDTILVVMGGGFTAAEETLFTSGHGQTVRDSRHAFQDSVEWRMRETVERASGRTVIAFLAASHQDPDLTVLTFVLNPTEHESPLSAPDQTSPS